METPRIQDTIQEEVFRPILTPDGWLMSEEASLSEDAARRSEYEALLLISRYCTLAPSEKWEAWTGCGTTEGY